MKQFHDLAKKILAEGRQYDVDEERTGTGTIGLFGEQLRFNLQDGFPLLTTKHVPFNLIKAELIWMLSGSTNNNDLRELNGNDKPTIWEEWCIFNGDLGPIYGTQWRAFGQNFKGENWLCGIDQISNLEKSLRETPFSRRHIVSAWNSQDLPDEGKSPEENVLLTKMSLAPCHMLFQLRVAKLTLAERIREYNNRSDSEFVVEGGSTEKQNHEVLSEFGVPELGLCCRMDQRSADLFLGLPFNIAFYATLTHMFAHVNNMVPLELVIHLGDVHIYNNHRDQVHELLSREPFCLPKLEILNSRTSVLDFEMGDLEVRNYKRHSLIKADVAI